MILVMAPIMMFAQENSRASKGQSGEKYEVKVENYVYGDVTIGEVQGRVVIRVEFGTTIGSVYGDKEFRLELQELKQASYTNLADALNTLSSYGWHVCGDYDVTTRTGTDEHLIIRKGVVRLVKPEMTAKGKEEVKPSGTNAAKKSR